MSLFEELDELEEKKESKESKDSKESKEIDNKGRTLDSAPSDIGSKSSTKIFFSEHHQDDFVHFYISEILKKDIQSMREKGKYIDVGASNGKNNNNTFHFEKFLGWEGICIEANPDVKKELSSNRSCIVHNVAAYDSDGKTKFVKVEGSIKDLSGVIEDMQIPHIEKVLSAHKSHKQSTIDVETVMIQTLLDRLKWSHINYISIDACGSELKVLKGIDFRRTNVDIFTIDSNYGKNNESIMSFMNERGYGRVFKIGTDDVFVRIDMIETTLRTMSDKGIIKKE